MIKKTNELKTFTATDTIQDYAVTANVKTTTSGELKTIDSGAVYRKLSETPSSPSPIMPQTTMATFYLYENGSLNITATNSADMTKMTEIINLFIEQL